MSESPQHFSPDFQKLFQERLKLNQERLDDSNKDLDQETSQERNNVKQKVVLIILGSKSDLPKIQEDILDELQAKNILYYIETISGHRNQKPLDKVINQLPNLPVSDEFINGLDEKVRQAYLDTISEFEVVAVATGAGMSAHIAGVAAASSQSSYPIGFFSISSSVGGGKDRNLDKKNRESVVASFSGGCMPPGVPTGLLPTQQNVADMMEKLYNLDLKSNFNQIQLDESLKNINGIQELIEEFGLTIGNSPITINTQNIEIEDNYKGKKNEIAITIATVSEPFNWENQKKMENLNRDGFYMGFAEIDNIKSSNAINAIMYAAQLIGRFNPKVKEKAKQYFAKKAEKTLNDNFALEKKQLGI